MGDEAASRDVVLSLFGAAGKACDAAGVKWAIQHRWAMELHGLAAPPDEYVPCMLVENFAFRRLMPPEIVLGTVWLGAYGRVLLLERSSHTMASCVHVMTPYDDLVLQHAVRMNGRCVEPIESLLVRAAEGSFDAFASRRGEIDWALVDALLERSEPGDQRQRLAEWRG